MGWKILARKWGLFVVARVMHVACLRLVTFNFSWIDTTDRTIAGIKITLNTLLLEPTLTDQTKPNHYFQQ